MLQIIVNNQQVDLLEDTEVSIPIEHPMLSTDHIPVPYSTDIDLPLSPRNRVIFGFVDRPARTAAFESLPARIFFDGLEITSGEIKVSEVEETITASYNGVMIPANVDKMAYRQNLGRIDFGASAVQVACNNYFIARTEEEYPDLVAAPVSIDARVTGEIVDGNTITQVSAAAWLNGYDESNGDYLPDQYRRDSHLNKILPAFRVGWLLDKLLDGRCVNNIFNTGEWRRLMILSTWHPRYKPDDQSAVYDIDDQGNASLTLADFMPKKAANEIITELLKLPCASMYATGDSFTIELNRDILDRKVIGDDWTGKVIGRVTISEQEAQRYVAGYSQEDAELAADLQVTDSDDILHICSLNPTQEIQPGTFNVANTGQVIERIAADDVTGVDFNVLQQRMSIKEEQDPDDDRSDYDMSFGGSVVTTNIGLHKSTDNTYGQGHRWYYSPQIGEAVKERPENLLVALYYGMCREIRWAARDFYNYPYLTHCNYDCRGNRLGDLSLSFTQTDGLATYHSAFKAWIERAHRMLKCKVHLNAVDLHNLDMRNKIMYKNKLYYISSITINLRTLSIEPAEAELIEA